jgi:hypothetical protein
MIKMETFLKGAFIRMYQLCGGRIAVSRALYPEPLNGVASREEVVFYEKKRLSDGDTARGSGNGYSVAITRRLCACGYGTNMASLYKRLHRK